MATAVPLPDHSRLFHYNMTAAVTRDGFSSSVNIFNYFTNDMSDGAESDAVADILFYDENGNLGFRLTKMLPPAASLHVDVGEELRRAGHPGETIGTAYTRIIPLKVPAALVGKQVSSECTGEIVTPEGARDFIHNTGGPVYSPNTGRMECGLMFTGPEAHPKYITLINNYLGPRWPVISSGFAKIGISNHKGEVHWARTETVPAAGMTLFSIQEAFPDLEEFLDGECGKLSFYTANLSRKSWVWFGPKGSWADITIEHM
jgi:hypothetical protein